MGKKKDRSLFEYPAASLLTKIIFVLKLCRLKQNHSSEDSQEKALNHQGSPLKGRKAGQSLFKGLHAAHAEDGGATGKETCRHKRALSVVCDDCNMTASALRSRDASMQVDFGDFHEGESPITKTS